MHIPSVILALSCFSVALGQLADTSAYPVGPLTSTAQKWATKVCDITKYGAVADGKTDAGPAILAAFKACASGGVVNIPLGTFAMETWVTLNGGNAWAINLEGTIVRTGTAGGNMIYIEHSTDFEIYSSRGTGAIQGYGYQFHEQGQYGPRLLRLHDVTNFAIHDIALVDSPAFHLTLDTCNQGEVYNMIIRGGNRGGLDGIDLWGFDIWVHDVEVTNKDECVTVKNPSNHIQVENIYCNWSGGCGMGSLGADTNISKVLYNNIYTVNSNQMFMFKSNGGSGEVSQVTLQNFIGHQNAYSLYLNSYWSDQTSAGGDGILYNSITFNNWKGTCANGAQRPPLYILCPSTNPCTNINIENFNMWTESGNTEYYKCADAWGSGYCLHGGTQHTKYGTVTSTVTAAPPGYSAPTMPGQLNAGLGITTSIAIPTVPNSFFPGATPATRRVYGS
ncbi:extracellular rhamnogalacturonase, putative [Talaromyces stipitatus ATCC 10500]|uniref:Extracellular rhamnogalacturonase, putative n=1 Tax=Talaromyces stipitatus (strain ATCC 10500 / CBS 375.48 / QM 6759 / NRRL 1006) TaxID=441959 RepID=B8MI13_TALSN|nr:extracellular rhamnogalacturonase, putative [Talaromyces stipitatus ATCC 10500]EED17175.1 extracellular rhamnogalacturonase, putative [Talaromyces stipitatus ATCC 10500]